MNRQQRHSTHPQGSDKNAIKFRGKAYSIDEARALAIKEYQCSNFQIAAEIFQQILAKASDHAGSYNNLAISLQSMRRYEEALVNYDKAIALQPDYAEAYYGRGCILHAMKRYDDALASCDKAIALKPDFAEAYDNKGATLQEMKRYDEALVNSDKAIALNPNIAEAYYNRGMTLLSMGNMQEAQRMFRQSLALKPEVLPPLLGLVGMHKYRDANHADIKHIQHLLNTPRDVPLRDQDYLYFSLGKMYDDCGLYDEAFEYYRQGNELRNKAFSYSPDKKTETTNAIIEVFSKDFLAQKFPFASSSHQPLFIVGMPRSGTTLMASILSNHPSIATAGELPTIIGFTVHLPELVGNGIPYPQTVKQLTQDMALRLIHDYEKRLQRDAGSGVAYIIDKHPMNFRHLGFISMLFPKARIIHCMRHPLDTCLSNYFQRFATGYDYSFDLRNIGHFYGEYERLMEHWRKVLPTPMIEIRYEDMTLNTEFMARKTLDVLGMEWDARCLSPHTNPAPVETASNWQVRQPIYKQSVERWRHYEKHLQPLKEMLGMHE